MLYRIYRQDAETLSEKPESGMGYQIVTASQYERTQIRKFIVYNTNLAIELDSDFLYYRKKIINEGYINMLNSVEEIMLETNSITVLDQSSFRHDIKIPDFKKKQNKRLSGGRGATDSPKEYANGRDQFVRISAYEDDKRIDLEKRRLKPGSFSTTLNDYNDCVSTNDDPIDRYALPNDEGIKWSFYIRPASGDILQKGIVQPAFNHLGGGIEAYFDRGTSAGTYLYRRDYGK